MVVALHIYSCFLQQEQIFRTSKWGRLQDPVAVRPGDQMMGRSRDARETLVLHVF